jgi:H+/Cl- antiporter ClcA
MEPPQPHPDFVDAIRQELSDWRSWLARAVVLAHAAAAGLAVVGFTALADLALRGFNVITAWQPWLPFVWMPACAAAIVWVTRRHVPGAAGSGIPQVMAGLAAQTPPQQLGLFVSLKLSLAKVVLTAAGLLGGLSIGREGPSVQVAAGIMQSARRWLPESSGITSHALLVAGGAAGIAAAFNTPLAGIVFAIEELSRRIEQRSSGLIIAAIVLAGLMAVSVFGNSTYFGVIHVPAMGLGLLWPGLLVVLLCGLAGGLFSRLLITSLAPREDRIGRWQRNHPVRFAAACGLVLALIGWVTAGATFGSGYGFTQGLLAGEAHAPGLVVVLRFISTWISAACGVPGGIFAPSLTIGAGIGSDVAMFTGGHAASAALIAMGMAAFLAAVTQAPITAFIIVMEMVDGHAMVLSLMTAALGASLVSRWVSAPLYATLAGMQLQRLQVDEQPVRN